MLHLTRALLAAAITCSIAPFVLLLWFVIGDLSIGWRSSITDIFTDFVKMAPELVGIFALLILFVGLSLAALHAIPVIRRRVAVPWIAALTGAILGMLLSPAWVLSVDYFTDGTMDIGHYFDQLPLFLTLSAITGAVFTFLHAFFVQRALAKKAWLAKQP